MADGSGHDAAVVVGVDGSDSSVEALRWAARQARLTGATLCRRHGVGLPGTRNTIRHRPRAAHHLRPQSRQLATPSTSLGERGTRR